MNLCWVCESTDLSLARHSTIHGRSDGRMFAITNYQYGQTGELERCRRCGFLQCSKIENLLREYENLEDPDFEKTRHSRLIQERKLVETVRKFRFPGKLLDVGAASGALVEEAIKLGYAAEGIEPSRWLQGKAAERGLPVYCGTLPHPNIRGPYDVITLVDVIEHLQHPADMIRQLRKLLAQDGIILIITPNVDSWMARFMGWKWWHYRVAHVGYFAPKTLDILMDRVGFSILFSKQAIWYFDLAYLSSRIKYYLPHLFSFKPPSFFNRIIVPLCLGDSMLRIYSRKEIQ